MTGLMDGRRSGLAVLLLLSCTGTEPGAWRGSPLPEPVARPDFTLTDTEGRPFAFAGQTAGRLTLLFFGYTSCPDVCPVHMANLAAVLARQSYETRSRVRVVFVSTDPARDTPERIREWLDGFDPTFVGVYGDIDEVNAIQRSLGLPPSEAGEVHADGSYDIGHAAGVLAFEPDGPARVMYLFGTRQADWEHDLPRLLRRTPDPEA